VQLLLAQINNNEKNFVPQFEVLKTHLIIRGST
jgi:DNA-binding LacI/PurR family transcriptional regulator